MTYVKEFSTGPFVPVKTEAIREWIRIWSELKDGKVYVNGKRINGSFVCPKCGLHWPLDEETECWTHKGRKDSKGREIWEHLEFGDPVGWCEQCDVFVLCGFDGDYVIESGQGGT